TLAGLVALQAGELDVADAVLERALTGGQGGGCARQRLLLLRAWVAMVRGRPEEARAAVAEVREGTPAPRDLIVLRSLEVGLARHTGDLSALVQAWQDAREIVLRFPVDLFMLPALGELLVTASRLDDRARLETHVQEAWTLLGRLGDPVLWSVPLHWAAVQAALLAERPGDLAPHAAALAGLAGESALAAAMTAAGQAWVRVLAAEVDAVEVEQAARGLATAGLPWDASRLAAHAAARTENRGDLVRLLACAQELCPDDTPPESQLEAAPAGSTPDEDRSADHGGLSAREREVAHLVLAGMTYREVGEVIDISPRTVEHHVARIRRRLNVSTRGELLVRLRELLGADPGGRAARVPSESGLR
ncbi:LuxR C-terminal-related transcriptional regulator, partial [Georgenia sp. 10Sc9-8]|nr:LuxR C-terminal-related transcriptional regulator [Georgenia halotolerans]